MCVHVCTMIKEVDVNNCSCSLGGSVTMYPDNSTLTAGPFAQYSLHQSEDT